MTKLLDHRYGHTMDKDVRGAMGASFGCDFSHVRVHSDQEAAASAHAVQAHAYTYGTDIVFGAGRYAPSTPGGRRLLAHELGHVVEQTCGRAGAAPVVQAENDRQALMGRLQTVRARLAQLRALERMSTERFVDSAERARQRDAVARGMERDRSTSRSERAAPELWGGTVAGRRMRRAATVARSGDTVTLTVNIQIAYAGMADQDAQKRAKNDIPRIESAISDAWQVDITRGEYAGMKFRLLPRLTYLRNDLPNPTESFVIRVRTPDSEPSSGTAVTGVISLAPAHLEGSRVTVVAHELAHLFGFVDTYLEATATSSAGKKVEQFTVGRSDTANRPDLLGMIDPDFLQRKLRKGAVSKQDVERQTRPAHVWEEDASIVLRVFGVAPPKPQRPAPDSEDFDPAQELDRERREGESRLAPIREGRRRAEESMQWLSAVEEIMQLEREEGDLVRRLGATP
ncbi:eCIS core domain-containing protein [Streptomyces hiroshimensis]|uniref:eCIS core domain-containing protein n=1 Tax=Streptomyces hiroshimensis TaxID=66424 RepID=UPI001E33919C|nr:DUF4157 domain-containing protein [Streptomyces hiroshimensis]